MRNLALCPAKFDSFMYSDKKNLDKPYCRITAPAKAILCGEHAVVYGEDAIALAIGLHCTA